MSLLVVGSIALDTVTTPFGAVENTLGGSATYFSAAASHFSGVKVVGVVGEDYPFEALDFLRSAGVDLAGVSRVSGESFRWAGEYTFDLNTARTVETRLGVFADFRPRIPEAFRDAEWVFLANIDPVLQLEVLEQVRAPRLVACDTMNYWIDGRRDELLELLRRVDVFLVNDAEIRALTGEHNLLKAAREVQRRGPGIVVVKKGEHGAMLFTPDLIFFAPGFPLEDIFDPTGAGDAFAGGFLGHIARSASTRPEELRRAMVYGSTMGSFAVERFGIDRFRDLTPAGIDARFAAFREITAFEQPIPADARA